MNSQLNFSASVEIRAAAEAGKAPRIHIVGYGGGAMRVGGYGEVAIDLAGLRFAKSIPILADHDGSLKGLIGGGEPRIVNGQVLIDGVLSTVAAAAQLLIGLHKDGLQLQASVGVAPEEREYIEAGTSIKLNNQEIKAGSTGLTIIRAGVLREVSVTPLGADANTSVQIAAKNTALTQGQSKMNTEKTGLTFNEIKAINAACDLVQHDDVASLRAQALDGKIDFPALQEQLRKIIVDSRPKAPGVFAPAPVPTTDVLACGLLNHYGFGGVASKSFKPETLEASARVPLHSGLDLARAALAVEGRVIPSGTNELLRAAFSTNSLASTIRTAAERILAQQYASEVSAWRTVCGRRSATNFREQTIIRPFLSNATFEKIAGDGELKAANITGETYVFQLGTYGRLFGINRQNLIDDSGLGSIFDLMTELARGADRAVSDRFANVLLGNAGSFFAGGNNNYLSGGSSVLSVTSLATAIQKLREQVDTNNKPINLQPSILLCPPVLEPTARALLNSTELARYTAETVDLRPTGNPTPPLSLVIEPRLSNTSYTGYSTTAWYLLSNPASSPTIVAGFLGGSESPVVEEVPTAPEFLGTTWRGYLDFDVALADFRAGVKSAGA